MKQLLFTIAALLVSIQAFAQSEQGAMNQYCDAALFQNKCACCHTIGLMSTTCEVLPSQVWCMVKRMANYPGANIYGCECHSRLFFYAVNFNTRARAKELEEALNCIPEDRRCMEEHWINEAKRRYE